MQRGFCDARARIERGAEPLAVLVAVRRIAVSGSRLGQRDVPMWAINERWIVVQWGDLRAGRLVAFNRRSGRIAVEEWKRSHFGWVWVLSGPSLALARKIGRLGHDERQRQSIELH